MGTATEELQYLMNFNSSIMQCMAKAMEYLSDFVFNSMANVALVRRDSYLAHVKSGLKLETLAALRQAPLDLSTSVSLRTKVALTLSLLVTRTVVTNLTEGQIDRHRNRSPVNRPGKRFIKKKGSRHSNNIHHVQPRGNRPLSLNDNYCVNAPVPRWLN